MSKDRRIIITLICKPSFKSNDFVELYLEIKINFYFNLTTVFQQFYSVCKQLQYRFKTSGNYDKITRLKTKQSNLFLTRRKKLIGSRDKA